MMQDYPMVLSGASAAACGFTSVSPALCFSPVKNAAADGAATQAKGTQPGVAASGESDQYAAASKIMASLGCRVEKGANCTWDGVEISSGPKIVVSPTVAPCPLHYKALFPSPSSIVISGRSSLVITGEGDVVVESLNLDGALVIVAGPKGSKTVVKDAKVSNKGWTDVAVDKSAPEVLRMRGYNLSKVETCTFEGSASGEYAVKADYSISAPEAPKAEAAAAVQPPKVVEETTTAPAAAPEVADVKAVEAVEANSAPSSDKKESVEPVPVPASPASGEAGKAGTEAGTDPARDASIGHGKSNDCGCSLM